MITASHNKVTDNGVKIADPSGGMLSQDWEPFSDQLANEPDPQSLVSLIEEFVKKERIPFNGKHPAEVLLGRDTRPSGESLLEAAKQGISAVVGAVAHDMGILTTPQLHWMVRARNKGLKATESDYFEQLLSSFRCLMNLIPDRGTSNETEDKLIVDGANGVGGEKLEVIKEKLNELDIEVRNSGKEGGVLNEGVGADFVQKEKVVPHGFGSNHAGIRCASLDGDADRLVYFLVPPNNCSKIDLVDGDKILSLFAVFIKEQLSILEEDTKGSNNYKARLGAVQTAYANGASTYYLRHLGLEVALAPTGVKFLHEKAAQYDIGIYFEANGHGTILFSERFLSWLEDKNQELSSTHEGSEQKKAALRLLAVSKLINQAVGDALSGLLLVETILRHMGWSIHQWNALYQDLPSRQLKGQYNLVPLGGDFKSMDYWEVWVKVGDRTAVVTANAETVAVKPPGIQEAINVETVYPNLLRYQPYITTRIFIFDAAKYPNGRSFIRPSGTEDVVRVYAEASTQEAADKLANSVAELVDRFLGFRSS
ncbi:phosphoacetylglucosamine mutase [Citrus sinensis]|uniref:Phosphoacetylglucosamine mutase n=1 Tax=Citrus sinensis TaxID=2711 RepID=A0ACB8L8V9_CITSI|nr:phosphoacetylglucosamine mutase [Citrus sinensis]